MDNQVEVLIKPWPIYSFVLIQSRFCLLIVTYNDGLSLCKLTQSMPPAVLKPRITALQNHRFLSMLTPFFPLFHWDNLVVVLPLGADVLLYTVPVSISCTFLPKIAWQHSLSFKHSPISTNRPLTNQIVVFYVTGLYFDRFFSNVF